MPILDNIIISFIMLVTLPFDIFFKKEFEFDN